MCIARNPYSQRNALLIEFDESPIDAATASQDNIIQTSRIETPHTPTYYHHEENFGKAPSPVWSLIRFGALVCVALIVILTLQRKKIAQDEEIEALQTSMLRLRTWHESQTRRMADLKMEQANSEFQLPNSEFELL